MKVRCMEIGVHYGEIGHGCLEPVQAGVERFNICH